MTLLATEIHHHDQPDCATIVFAADRRISIGPQPYSSHRKIFEIQILNAGIGYFGLAEVPSGRGVISMEDWLVGYLSRVSSTDLSTFAQDLASALNTAIPTPIKRAEISGFHICGFNSRGQPEFWFVRNVQDDRQTIFGHYEAREDFQRRDAPQLQPGEFQIYRNGDIRAHVQTWEALDISFGRLLGQPHFRTLNTPNEHRDWVKFKMETIVRFYEAYCTISIIGGPVDCFALTRRHPT